MRDGRFHVHDEWDFFGAYLQGHLDPQSPICRNYYEIALDGCDLDLQAFLRGERGRQPPGRHIPERLLQMLRRVDASDEPGRSDAVCAVLALPDVSMAELDGALGEVINRAKRDGRTHTATVRHPWQDHGACIACGGEPEEARNVAERAIDSAWARTGVRSWFIVTTDPTLSAATSSVRRI